MCILNLYCREERQHHQSLKSQGSLGSCTKLSNHRVTKNVHIMIFSFIWSIRRKHPLKLLTAVLEKYSVKVTGWRFAEEEDGCAVSYEAKLVGEGGTGPGAHYGLPLIRHHTKVIFCAQLVPLVSYRNPSLILISNQR